MTAPMYPDAEGIIPIPRRDLPVEGERIWFSVPRDLLVWVAWDSEYPEDGARCLIECETEDEARSMAAERLEIEPDYIAVTPHPWIEKLQQSVSEAEALAQEYLEELVVRRGQEAEHAETLRRIEAKSNELVSSLEDEHTALRRRLDAAVKGLEWYATKFPKVHGFPHYGERAENTLARIKEGRLDVADD